jgi:hypothetical protein
LTAREIEEAKEFCEKMGWKKDMDSIIAARDERARIEADAKDKTLKAKRKRERHYEDKRIRNLGAPAKNQQKSPETGNSPRQDDTSNAGNGGETRKTQKRPFDPSKIDLSRVVRV